MNGKEAKQALEKYKRLYDSLAKANQKAERTIQDLKAQAAALSANLINANNALDINKTILRDATDQHNLKEKGLIDLLTNLKAKLREMGYHGNFDNLGN